MGRPSKAATASARASTADEDSDVSSATTVTASSRKGRGDTRKRKRRKALTEEEDVAILRAVLRVKPYHAAHGHGRRLWQQTADLVVEETGGDMDRTLCQGRFENIVKRFTHEQANGGLWPLDATRRELVMAAVEEKKSVMSEKDGVGMKRRMIELAVAATGRVVGETAATDRLAVTSRGTGETTDRLTAATTDRGVSESTARPIKHRPTFPVTTAATAAPRPLATTTQATTTTTTPPRSGPATTATVTPPRPQGPATTTKTTPPQRPPPTAASPVINNTAAWRPVATTTTSATTQTGTGIRSTSSRPAGAPIATVPALMNPSDRPPGSKNPNASSSITTPPRPVVGGSQPPGQHPRPPGPTAALRTAAKPAPPFVRTLTGSAAVSTSVTQANSAATNPARMTPATAPSMRNTGTTAAASNSSTASKAATTTTSPSTSLASRTASTTGRSTPDQGSRAGGSTISNARPLSSNPLSNASRYLNNRFGQQYPSSTGGVIKPHRYVSPTKSTTNIASKAVSQTQSARDVYGTRPNAAGAVVLTRAAPVPAVANPATTIGATNAPSKTTTPAYTAILKPLAVQKVVRSSQLSASVATTGSPSAPRPSAAHPQSSTLPASSASTRSETPPRNQAGIPSTVRSNAASSAVTPNTTQSSANVSTLPFAESSFFKVLEKAWMDDRNRDRSSSSESAGARQDFANGSGGVSREEFQELLLEVRASRQERAELKEQVASLTTKLDASQQENTQLSEQVALLAAMVEENQQERTDLKHDVATLASLLKDAPIQGSMLRELDDAQHRHAEELRRYQQEEEARRRVAQLDDRVRFEALEKRVEALQNYFHDQEEPQREPSSGHAQSIGPGEKRSRAFNPFAELQAMLEKQQELIQLYEQAQAAQDSHSRTELELAELRTALEVERADRTREYSALLDNIQRIVSTSESTET